MNPLRWRRERQIAGVVVATLGAVLGLMLGFIHSEFFSMERPWDSFATWLSNPEVYWRWPLSSFVICGIAFYSVHLLRHSN